MVGFIKDIYLKYGHCLGYTSELEEEDKIFCHTIISILCKIVDSYILIYQIRVDKIINNSDYEEFVSENKSRDH